MPTRTSLEEFFTKARDREMLESIDLSRLPRHVAVIMDGNGRWAAKRGLPRAAGHQAGVRGVREAIATCLTLGIEVLTIYSFSSENWRRPADEVGTLMRLFVEVLERELADLERRGVRVRVIGRRAGLPARTAEAFARAEERTGDGGALTLVVALNYGGRAEIADAVTEIASAVAAGTLEPSAIGEQTVSDHLQTAGLPDPDLVIRTSGELRISNFLLWQIAYAELWVTPVLWPDFKRGHLLTAIRDYQSRTRRFGGTS